MKRRITISQFVDDLLRRIDEKKDIDCCREDIKSFARHVRSRIGDEHIEVEWKDEARK